MPEREPPAVSLDELAAAARRRGCTFEQAWETALATALRVAGKDELAEWADVLVGMVESWRAAYDRVPATPRELAPMAVASDPDRVPVRGRWCQRCGGAIPDHAWRHQTVRDSWPSERVRLQAHGWIVEGEWRLRRRSGVVALAVASCAMAAAGLAVVPATAGADSAGATVRSLPESGELQVHAEYQHECPGYQTEPAATCDWFTQASAYSASAGCLYVFDDSHIIWSGSVETRPGSSVARFAFNPYRLASQIIVCLYIWANNESTLVGQSHPFDRMTGREVLPPPPKPSARPVHPVLCGTVHVHAYEVSEVSRMRARVSCANARRLVVRYLSSRRDGVANLAPEPKALPGGWRCRRVLVEVRGQVSEEDWCLKGGSSYRTAREWIASI